MGNAPVVEDPREAGIGVVVDHDNLGAAEVELLHGAQPDAVEAAEYDMALHVFGLGAVHPRMLPCGSAVELPQR